MQTYLKTKPAWMQLLLFLGMAFGLFMIGLFVGLLTLPKITGVGMETFQNSQQWDLSNPAILTFIRGMLVIQFIFLFLVPSLLFAYFSDPQPAHYLGLQVPDRQFYWLAGLLVILVAYPLVEYIGYLNQKISLGGATNQWMKSMEEDATRQIKFMLQRRTPGELIKNLVFISLFAGIGEELFFRGVLQRIFIRMTQNPWMGIVLTAAIFSGIHFQFYGFFPRFLLGILLGAIYWYSGSLWTAILAHFLYDASVIVFLYINPEAVNDDAIIKGQGVQLLVGALISLLLTVAILRYMKRKSLASYEEVYKDDFDQPSSPFSF